MYNFNRQPATENSTSETLEDLKRKTLLHTKQLLALIQRFRLGEDHIDPKTFREATLAICNPTAMIPITKLREVSPPSEEITELLENNQAAFVAVSEHHQKIQQQNFENLPTSENITKNIKAYIKVDDSIKLASLMKKIESSDDVFTHFDFSIRAAAHMGAIKCLRYLLQGRLGNKLTPGPTSGKIALHFAIESTHFDCIEALLKSVGRFDVYEADRQLLYGTKPKRPIDLIAGLPSEEASTRIVAIIRTVIDDNHYNHNIESEKLAEIREILDSILAAAAAKAETVAEVIDEETLQGPQSGFG